MHHQAQTCIQWAISRGAVVDGMVVASLPGRGNSLIASTTTSTSRCIFIPKDILLTLANIQRFADTESGLRDILTEWSTRVSMTSRRAIILLMAYASTHATPWSPYLASLPDYVDSPIFWTDAERALLAGTSIAGVAEDKMSFLTAWLRYQQHQPEASDFTLALRIADLAKYEMLLDSRALLSNEDDSCMVPVIDFANHSSLMHGSEEAQNAAWHMDEEGFHLSTLPNQPDGREILFSYGKRGNAELLFKYGFVEESQIASGSRSMTIEVPLDDTFPAAAFGEPSFRTSPDTDDLLYDVESSFLWVYTLHGEPEADLEHGMYKGTLIEKDTLLTRLMGEPEWHWLHYKACTIALECLTAQLQHLESTEQDETLKALAESVSPYRLHVIDAVRDAERQTHVTCIATLQARRAALPK